MDRIQINEQIEQLQVQLRAAIKLENFDQATQLQVQINRYKALKDNYRRNYDSDEHSSSMSYDQLQEKINSLSNELQGAVYLKEVESAQNLSSEINRYQEMIRLIDLDRKL